LRLSFKTFFQFLFAVYMLTLFVMKGINQRSLPVTGLYWLVTFGASVRVLVFCIKGLAENFRERDVNPDPYGPLWERARLGFYSFAPGLGHWPMALSSGTWEQHTFWALDIE
jgi:hypothetical protein